VQRFRGGLVFKAYRLVYHSTLGSRVIKKIKKRCPGPGRRVGASGKRECIDYKTSMITDEDPLRGLLFY